MAEQQKFTIKISKKYNETERYAIGLEVIDLILARTGKGLDKKNKPFASYSEEYRKSLDFKLGGKTGKVNLELSGEMLGAVEVLDTDKDGEITIGIPKDDDFNNGKAEGNIKGTYGQAKPIKGKKRDFMGIHRDDLNKIKGEYSIKTKEDREKTRSRALGLLVATDLAEGIIDALDPGTGDNVGE